MENNETMQANVEHKWYAINTRSGHEYKTADQIRQRVRANGLEAMIPEVLVPTQDKLVPKDGKIKTVTEKIYPGYVLVKMQMNDDTRQFIRYTEGVLGFVGQSKDPEPLKDAEIKALTEYAEAAEPTYKAAFKVGNAVTVIDGHFKGLVGKVVEINEAKGKVTVLLNMFGREMPVPLDFLQVTT